MANEQSTEQETPRTPPPAVEVEESKMLPPGDYVGDVVDFAYRESGDEKYPYLDVYIKERETGVELKAGYACKRVTPENDLGKLLSRFGAEVVPGKPADWSVLSGPCSFSTVPDPKNKRFARVKPETVAPLTE